MIQSMLNIRNVLRIFGAPVVDMRPQKQVKYFCYGIHENEYSTRSSLIQKTIKITCLIFNLKLFHL